MEFEVSQIFDSWISSKFGAKPDIARYLLRHERRPMVIQRVCEQIRIAELSNIRKRFDTSRYRMVIEACAGMFCNAAINYAEQQAMSRAEMIRRMDEASRFENLTAEFQELENETLSTKLVSRPGDVAR